MEENTELAKLEQFVDKLLTKYNELRENFRNLQQTLHERENECASLKEQVAELSSERSFVGERVASLIDRIEQWEAEQDQPENQREEPAGMQATLFEDNSETA